MTYLLVQLTIDQPLIQREHPDRNHGPRTICGAEWLKQAYLVIRGRCKHQAYDSVLTIDCGRPHLDRERRPFPLSLQHHPTMRASRSGNSTWRRGTRALPRGGGLALLEHPTPRQDGPRTSQGGQGQDTTSGQSGAGFRRQRRGGRHVGNLSTHWEHVLGTLCIAIQYPRWGTTHHSPSALHEPMGSCGASSAPRSAAQAARSTRMRAKSSMAARTCLTRSPASATAAVAASPSIPAWARRCRVPSRTASSRPSKPSTA